MLRLILFRHAKAEPRTPDGQDIDRPLAQSGLRDAAAMGRLLAAKGAVPDLALVSSALRTRQTWDCARPAFADSRCQVSAQLYNAAPEDIAAALAAVAESEHTVMIVGHNPGLQAFGVNLLIDGAAAPRDIGAMAASFPTAAAASFVFDAAGRAAFDGLLHPGNAQ